MGKKCPVLGTALYLDCLECEDKLCNKNMYNKIVIGIDQSYKNTGICIIADGKKKKLRSVQLDKYESNSAKREVLRNTITSILQSVIPRGNEVICIIERIRLFSRGFVNIDYIKGIGALNAVIVDVCVHYNIPIFSVDTRCWKSQVIGTTKGLTNEFGVPEEKWPTVKWCINNGWENDLLIEVEGRRSKGTFIRDGKKLEYNNDAADSAGIAMFGFVGDKNKLQEEK